MSLNTKKLIAINFFNESKKLATMLSNKEQLSDLERNWLESYTMLNDFYESLKTDHYLIIDGNNEEPLGICTKDGLIDVHKEEEQASFVKISENEFKLFNNSNGKIIPPDWKERKVYKYIELI